MVMRPMSFTFPMLKNPEASEKVKSIGSAATTAMELAPTLHERIDGVEGSGVWSTRNPPGGSMGECRFNHV
jgi:hypothetical protein